MTTAPVQHAQTSPVRSDARPSRESLLAANVNPDTCLATDYLNHFNGVVMLLDMLADMPELRDDVLAWAPTTYREHFERSGFSGRATAVAAYDTAPAAIRAAFEATVAAIDAKLVATQNELAEAEPEAILRIAPARAADLRPLLARADRMIHGAANDADAGWSAQS